jgi:hypothetical protein
MLFWACFRKTLFHVNKTEQIRIRNCIYRIFTEQYRNGKQHKYGKCLNIRKSMTRKGQFARWVREKIYISPLALTICQNTSHKNSPVAPLYLTALTI